MGDTSHHHSQLSKISFAGLLVTLGIIYGDIGTSPLYVMKSIVGDRPISSDLVLGGISCIFWTLTLQTTIKYIVLTLRADNKGEGGIFALYALVRRTKVKWLLFPAIIGGAALLGEGIITPAISVSSAIEGLTERYPEINTIPIIIGILFALFAIQQFGTKFIGKFFGPVMLVWFSMLAILGISQIAGDLSVFKAINPAYAYT
jgi:KUP system potassium uptake protein